jgi:hypothetical protein
MVNVSLNSLVQMSNVGGGHSTAEAWKVRALPKWCCGRPCSAVATEVVVVQTVPSGINLESRNWILHHTLTVYRTGSLLYISRCVFISIWHYGEDIVLSVTTGYELHDLKIGVRFLAEAEMHIFSIASRPASGPRSLLSEGVEWPWREAGHSPPSNVEITNAVPPTPP